MSRNRRFPNSPGPLHQNDVKCSAFDMQMIFHSHANFHKKGCALGLILKVRVFGPRNWKWPIASGIDTGDELVGYWPIFSLFLITVPDVFAKVNSAEFFLFVSKVAIAHSPRAHHVIAKL